MSRQALRPILLRLPPIRDAPLSFTQRLFPSRPHLSSQHQVTQLTSPFSWNLTSRTPSVLVLPLPHWLLFSAPLQEASLLPYPSL